jgi:hypothetical protein
MQVQLSRNRDLQEILIKDHPDHIIESLSLTIKDNWYGITQCWKKAIQVAENRRR